MRFAVLHFNAGIALILLLIPISGCVPFSACSDAVAGYEISADIIDSETLEPLTEAEVTIRLFREGEIVGGSRTGTSDQNGGVEIFDIVAFTGPCCVFLECLVDPGIEQSPLGDPPDRIEFVVGTNLGSGRVILPLDEADFGEFQNFAGVPFVGGMELGTVTVTISE